MNDFLVDLMVLVNKYKNNEDLGKPIAILSVLGSSLAIYEDDDKEDIEQLFLLSIKILGKQIVKFAEMAIKG